MDKREAKRRVCARVAIMLSDELDSEHPLDGLCDDLSDADCLRVHCAVEALMDELASRAGRPNPRRRPEVVGQRSIWDLLYPNVTTIKTDIL